MVTSAEDGTTVESLLALGSLSANAIIAPSSSAAHAVESDPALASRASDEPFVAIRFGCDDPLHDPASDHALPANYSAASLEGKAECRRALARRGSLALGPRTLLLATAPLRADHGRRGDPRRARAARRIRRRRGDPVLGRSRARRARQHPGDRAPGPHRRRRRRRSRRGAPHSRRRRRDPARRSRRSHRPRRRHRSALRHAAHRRRCRRPRATSWSTTTRDRRPARRSCSRSWARSRSRARFAAPSRLRADAELWSPVVTGLFSSAPRWATSAALIEEVCASYDLARPPQAWPRRSWPALGARAR